MKKKKRTKKKKTINYQLWIELTLLLLNDIFIYI